jgi:hypothetical protein
MHCCNKVTQINYDRKILSNITEIRFCGLTIDDALSWKQHLDQVINRLPSVCYTLQNIKYIVSFATIRVIYFAHIQSSMS